MFPLNTKKFTQNDILKQEVLSEEDLYKESIP